MSKKTRKKTSKKTPRKTLEKSSKPSPRTATRAHAKQPAKTATAKTRLAVANKLGKIAKKQTGKTAPQASHKRPLKPLKPSVPRPAVGNSPAKKPPAAKTDGPAVGKSAAAKSALAEGAKAPAFRLPRDGGDTVSLADYAGSKLVLFFYPRADTPGCTKEAIEFTRLSRAFAESQTAVLGVSADPLKAQEAFRDKHGLGIPLLSDEKHEMLEAYGAWGEKSMYGRTFQGILRTTVLIGADGRIIRIWRHVRVDGHADEVLATVRSG
jgi:thioredoxin-dependent peroxiredoxin